MDQFNIFDFTRQNVKINKPIRLIELFAGIGSQAMALRDIGADFEHYKVVEFDKFAIAAYNAIHGTDFPVTDITDIHGSDLEITDIDKYCYIMTYSFPCTDLSVAGKMMGMEEGSGTRSSLLWEVKRLLEETENLPQILLMENVTQVHSQDNMPHFSKWLEFLESKGYSNYTQDLNAKDFGVAQNRDRTFCVSILGEYNYKFPRPIDLRFVMKDYLEDNVDEKYYINSQKAEDLIQKLLDNGTIGQDDLTDRQTDRHGLSTLTEPSKECTSSKKPINLSLQNPRPVNTASCLTSEGARRSLSEKFTTASDGVVTTDLSVNEPRETTISNTIMSRQDRGISNHRGIGGVSLNTYHMNGNRVDKQSDIAKTLMARDYKGFGTGFDTQNGVIEETMPDGRHDGRIRNQ